MKPGDRVAVCDAIGFYDWGTLIRETNFYWRVRLDRGDRPTIRVSKRHVGETWKGRRPPLDPEIDARVVQMPKRSGALLEGAREEPTR